MKISYNWIKEYIKDMNVSAKDLEERLKSHLAEVENVENLIEKYKGIVIAEILEKKEHPNADKLGIYIVNIGRGKKVQVVAGDKTLNVGDKVVYLPTGTKVPFNAYPDRFDGIIQKTKLRGVDSDGMLASEKELDISSEHEKVMTLDIDCNAGDDFARTLDINDYIFEVENKALTIRPDVFGMIGISREISGILKIPFETPSWMKNPKKIKGTNEKLPLVINNKCRKFCPRYMAVTMGDINVTDSPMWLKARLSSLGIKSVNNVVDITNYIMILTGQPLHAFDYDKVKSKDIHAKNNAIVTIRTARKGEKITTIDGKTRELSEKNVIICDSQNPIAIGGIMGGLDTEIDENTKNIIIESANFDLYNIRKSSMELGLVTDAVTRFSKGQDSNLCEPSLYKAIEMISEICSGKIAGEIKDDYTELPKPHKLTFSISYLCKHTGLKLTKDEILKILSNVEIHDISETEDTDLVTLEIPTYRQDLKIQEDIHEEVARLHGYNNIELTLPTREISATKTNASIRFDTKIRKALKEIGANEVLTYNFIGQKLYTDCDLNIENNYRLTNSLSPELEYMRSTLIPSLIEKVNININNGYEEFAIFEINKVHNKLDFDKKKQLPIEHKCLSFLITSDSKDIYYDTKFYLDNLLGILKIEEVNYESVNKVNNEIFPNYIKNILPFFDINRVAVVTSSIDNKKIYLGLVGEPNQDVLKNRKLTKPCGVFEINIANLRRISNIRRNFINFSKYPKIQQDLCFVLDKDIPYIMLQKNIEASLKGRDLNYLLKPVDIYEHSKEAKQITIRVVIQHKNKTLKEKDIASIRKLITQNAMKELKANLKE
jgi:phenylalanyl-tRNA synthetase beta chain